jgi:hypothetical protein
MDEGAREHADALPRRKRLVRRIAWGIVAAGSALAFAAALFGGAATRSSDQDGIAAALTLRNIAAGIMLMGLVTILVAQRLDSIQQWYSWRIEGRSQSTVSNQGQTIAYVIGATIVLLLTWTVVGSALPAEVRGCLVVMGVLAVPALLGLLVMQLRGTPRLFLIGMLLVAIGNLILTLLAVTALVSSLDSAGALRELGRVMFPMVTVVWTLFPASFPVGSSRLGGASPDRPRIGLGTRRELAAQRADHDRHVRRREPRQQLAASDEAAAGPPGPGDRRLPPRPGGTGAAQRACVLRGTDRPAALQGCEIYNDFHDVLQRDDIDVIWGCIPDHWHGVVYSRRSRPARTCTARSRSRAGSTEGIRVREMVRRYGCVFQTGTQQRSSTHFRHACELARNGYLGKVHTIHVGVPGGRTYPVEPPSDPPPGFDYDFWSGPAPLIPFDTKRCEWLAMYMISHYCAGFITNWGVHHLDIAGWGCPEVFQKPFEIQGHGRPAARRDDRHLDLLADGTGVGQRPEDELHQHRQSDPARLQVRGRCGLGPREPQRDLGRTGFAADRQTEARRHCICTPAPSTPIRTRRTRPISSAASAPVKIRSRPSRTDRPPAPWATWPTSRCGWIGVAMGPAQDRFIGDDDANQHARPRSTQPLDHVECGVTPGREPDRIVRRTVRSGCSENKERPQCAVNLPACSRLLYQKESIP